MNLLYNDFFPLSVNTFPGNRIALIFTSGTSKDIVLDLGGTMADIFFSKFRLFF